MSDLNFFDISQKFLRLVGDNISTMKTIFIDNALIPQIFQIYSLQANKEKLLVDKFSLFTCFGVYLLQLKDWEIQGYPQRMRLQRRLCEIYQSAVSEFNEFKLRLKSPKPVSIMRRHKS